MWLNESIGEYILINNNIKQNMENKLIFDNNEYFTYQIFSNIRDKESISISFLQRYLKLGYNRAGRLMDWLIENKIVDDNNKDNFMIAEFKVNKKSIECQI